MATIIAAASVAFCLALCLQTAAALPPPTGIAATTFTSLAPNKINVNITSYTVNNQTVQAGAPCTNMVPDNACLTQLKAARDMVHIDYSIKTGFPANSTPDFVMIKGCYSNYSVVDRPWRAYNNIITLSKKCPFVIKSNLNPVSGNVTWTIPNTVPYATYMLRAFVYRNVTQASGMNISQPLATGVSVGYFQINKIDDRPKGMKIAAGVCACIGPLMFLGYFLVDGLIKKNKWHQHSPHQLPRHSLSTADCVRWQQGRDAWAAIGRRRPRAALRVQAAASSVAEVPEVASDRGLSQEQRRPAPVAEKVGVLLLNLGGPETLDDVQPFLYNLFSDPDIIRLPTAAQFLQPLIATVISSLRAPKSAEGYKAIGGGSPLRRITEEQAEALSQALRRKGQEASVYVAMRYWKPFTEDAIEQVKRDGVSKLVILPLYPQFSISTSGSSLRLLEAVFKSDPALRGLPHTVIPSWYQRRGYIVAQADLIEAELARFDGPPDDVEIFFSAHGVPESYVEQAGDPYKEEMEQCIGFIMSELRERGIDNSYTLAYQSRVGPVEWLKPYTDETIRRLGEQGCRSMLAIPISFVSEHIETLEEMDMEYRELAMESGIQRWRRLPALNTNRTFIDDLADAVLEALPFAGSMAGSNPSDSLVPLGDVEALLETYDRERRVLPPPVLIWKWGWTKSAETWNGRIAMLAIVVVLVLEVVTGQGVLSRLPFT